ncbi:glycoside hydrolase family 31 protein [Granulicella arctica]|uniref:Alpha-glucosidase n=1 Tax=Granulicella arctica TaxID=940613 RepID=A0A7Y9TFG5_9BACT|nr:glycoside hydrolase family 31 protein [Granulicella arctica]NYF78324.1 alpha-glucosidase [Granulicella arctica]
MRHASLLCLSLLTLSTIASAQMQPPLTITHVTQVTPLPNGIAVTADGGILQITALRPDALRIRITQGTQLPEDASWAVLPAARTATTTVEQDSTATTVGFHTADLRVILDRASATITVTDTAGHILQQDIRPVEYHGTGFRLYKQMQPDEHFFGLGDKVGPLDRRGQAFTLWNSDTFGWQESTDPIYKSIPFFISFNQGRAVGILVDNTFRSSFDFGKELRDAYSFGAPDGPIDYYLLYGPTPKQVVEDYAWLTGPSPMPPLWSLGFQQSRYSYFPESRVMEIANRLRADHIPADAIYLDIDYQHHNWPFTVDTDRFPTFPGMIKELAAKQFHVVAITDLHIAKQPNVGYAPYDTGVAGDHFVKNPDGTYTGWVWPGNAVFPDFTQHQSREWWGTLYKSFYDLGIAGFWNDMNEPALFNIASKTMPDDVQHRIDEPGFLKRTTNHLEIHNIFGMENTRGTYEGLLKLKPDLRPFVLTRASYAGGQRYSATWTGDNSSTWNHLRLTTPMLLNLGLSGFAMSGADVGGFAGTPQPDLLTKWIELAAFQPIDRDHTADGTGDQEVWVHGPAQEDIRRRYIEQRYKLMPYLYTTAEQMARTGIPIVRPLFLEFPDATPDHHPLDLDAPAEFLFGPDLLVAPAPYPDELDAYEVHLPPGEWFDFWTGTRVNHAAPLVSQDAEQRNAAQVHLIVKPTLDVLPVYVRGGSILPLQPLVQSTNETPSGPLTLRVYPGDNCHGTLYQDDGISFAFRTGTFLRMDSTCQLTPGSLHIHIGAHQGTFHPWWKQLAIEVYGVPSTTTTATVNGKPYSLTAPSDGKFTITVPDTGKGIDLSLP